MPPDEATSVIVPEASRDDEERRRRLKPWAVGGGVAVVLVTGSVALSYTSVFGARAVEVEGEERMGPRQVMRLAEVALGTNVLHLDEGVAEARLEQEPWILDATVRTSLPGTISISIRERTPVLVLLSGSSRQLAAADGTVLGRAPKTPAFPELAVPEGVILGPGQVAATADVVAAMVPALRSRVDSLSIDLSAPAAPTARFVGSLQPTTVPDPSADVPSPDQGEDDDEGASQEPSPSP